MVWFPSFGKCDQGIPQYFNFIVKLNNNVNTREREEGVGGRQSSSNQLNQPGENDQIPFNMLFSKAQFKQLYNHMHVIITTLPTTRACKTPHVDEKYNLLPGAKNTLKSSQG